MSSEASNGIDANSVFSSTIRFTPLDCLNADFGVKEPVSVILTNINATKTNEKLLQVFRNIWNNAKYRAYTNSSKTFLFNECENEDMLPSNIQGTCEELDIVGKHGKSEISLLLEETFENIKKEPGDVLKIVICCGEELSLFDILNYLQNICACHKIIQKGNVLISAIFGQSYVCVLPKGCSEMVVTTGYEGEWCGLIPLGYPVRLTTTGLHWNLNDDVMQFGKLISTCNRLDGSGRVQVCSDHFVVWTMGILM